MYENAILIKVLTAMYSLSIDMGREQVTCRIHNSNFKNKKFFYVEVIHGKSYLLLVNGLMR